MQDALRRTLTIVWQARNRFMFANDADDADLLAHELASQTFDPKELKDQIEVFRQKKVGQSLIRLNNFSATNTNSQAFDKNSSSSQNQGRSYQPGQPYGESTFNDGKSAGYGQSEKNATSQGTSEGWSETLIDNLEDFYEVSSRTYYTFDEQVRRWARRVRQRKTGQAFAKFKDDNRIHEVDVDQVVIPMIPPLAELKAKLLEENFANRDLFLPTSEVQSKWNDFVQRLGEGTIIPPNQQAVIDAVAVQRIRGSNNDSDFR